MKVFEICPIFGKHRYVVFFLIFFHFLLYFISLFYLKVARNKKRKQLLAISYSINMANFTKHKPLISEEEYVPLYTTWSLFTSECMAKVNNVLWQCNQSSLWKKARTSLYDFEKKLSLRVGLRAKPIKDLFFFAAWHCGPQKYDMSISQMPKRVMIAGQRWMIRIFKHIPYTDRNSLVCTDKITMFLARYEMFQMMISIFFSLRFWKIDFFFAKRQ